MERDERSSVHVRSAPCGAGIVRVLKESVVKRLIALLGGGLLAASLSVGVMAREGHKHGESE